MNNQSDYDLLNPHSPPIDEEKNDDYCYYKVNQNISKIKINNIKLYS